MSKKTIVLLPQDTEKAKTQSSYFLTPFCHFEHSEKSENASLKRNKKAIFCKKSTLCPKRVSKN